MFRRVTRCGHYADLELAEGKAVTIGQRAVFELEACFRTRSDLHANACGDLSRAGEEVVVEMRIEDVRDSHAQTARGGEIWIDIPQWVEVERDLCLLRAHRGRG